MCELLVMARDNDPHSEPAKNQMVWKRGDVVVAFEDGHEWGREESKPPEKGGRFNIIRMPGVTLKQLSDETAKTFIAGLLDVPRDLEGKPIGRRVLKLDLDGLDATDKQAAEKEGVIAITKEAVAALAAAKPTQATREEARL